MFKLKRNFSIFIVFLVLLQFLMGCTSDVEKINDKSIPLAKSVTEETGFRNSVYHSEYAEGKNGVLLDISDVSKGYIGLSVVSDKKLKLQIIKGDKKYTYDVLGNGEPQIFPLQLGNGEYKIKVMKNISDTKYSELYSKSVTVELKNEFEPFLRPNCYVNYDEFSESTLKAQELVEDFSDEAKRVYLIYEYISKNVEYDTVKADTVSVDYIPDISETLRTNKGICFDYAALAAAMLRSIGIPTKMIFGYVGPNDLYHAWNVFYTKETGWVTVNFKVDEKSWNRLDLTFTANGAEDEFIAEDANYIDIYFY